MMRKLFSLILTACLLLASCTWMSKPAPSTPVPTPSPETVAAGTGLTAKERLSIFNTVWQIVNDKYFDPTFGGLDWQAIGDKYRQKLETVQDDETFWREVLIPMLWELGASHLAALPPELANQIDAMTFATGTLGMDIRLLDGLAVVTRVDEGSPAADAGLQPGFVITSVDGKTLETILAEALRSPPYNESPPACFPSPRATGSAVWGKGLIGCRRIPGRTGSAQACHPAICTAECRCLWPA